MHRATSVCGHNRRDIDQHFFGGVPVNDPQRSRRIPGGGKRSAAVAAVLMQKIPREIT